MRSRATSAAIALCAGLIALVLVTPVIAWAHAELTKSDPANKSALTSSPTEIRLWFSEGVEISMTHIVVKDSAGVAVPIGPTERAGGDTAVRAKLIGLLPSGHYTIEWRNMSTDGHPLNGTIRFIVRPPAPGSAAAVPTTTDTSRATAVPQSHPASVSEPQVAPGNAEAPGDVIARAVTFIALLALIGAVAFRVVVLGRTSGIPDASRLEMDRRAATLGAWAGALLLVGSVARLCFQSAMMNGPAAFDPNAMGALLTDTHWGHVWVLQLIVTVVALCALIAASRGGTSGWTIATPIVVMLAATPALGGHAGATPDYAWMSVTFDAIHVLAASTWLGTLLCIAAVGVPVAYRLSGDTRWTSIASLVRVFSPMALVCAGTVAFTGIVNWRFRVGTIPALWTSGYGQVLLVKLCIVAAVVVMGLINWQRVRPRLGTESATASFKKSASTELFFGALVLVVTAVLVAMPPPRMPG